MSQIVENGNWSVYVHINKTNGKCYVGITGKSPEKRWLNGSGYHGQPFYKAIKKYGWDGFDHEIVASNLTKEEAENFEQILIQKLNSLIEHNGYNASIGGGVPVFDTVPIYQFDFHGSLIKEYGSIADVERLFGIPTSNIVACCKGAVNCTGGYIWRYKKDVLDIDKFRSELDISVFDIYEPVYQFDMDKNFIAEHKSASEASKQNPKWFSSSILDNCRGKYKQACGYIWRFKKDVPDISVFKNEIIDMSKKLHTSPVLQFDLDGNFVKEFSSVKEAAKFHNCSPHMISYACSGRSKTGVGYLWRRKRDYNGEKLEYTPFKPAAKRVLQYDLDDNFIAEYESTTDIVELFGFCRSCIKDACVGKQKTAYGFKWKYVA